MHVHICTSMYGRPYMHAHTYTRICTPLYACPYTHNAIGELFIKSLQAEIEKHPELPNLLKVDGDKDPPEIMFRIGTRRVGYFKAKHLCRVWTLKCLRWLRTRGEFFVCWKDGNTGTEYDGRLLLAHAFTLKYLSLHQPSLSVIFDKNGALKSTSQIFTKIRK